MDDPPDAPPSPEPPPGPATAGPDTLPPQEPQEPRPVAAPTRPGPGGWRLRRSVRDRKLKGVAGGVAAAADVDPTLVRLLFVAAAFSGWGVVAYIVLAVVLRDELVEDPARPLPREQRRMLRIGLLVAAVVAVGRLFDGWFFTGRDIGLPFLLIAVGAAVLWARRDQVPPEALAYQPDPAGAAVPPGAWPVAPGAPPLGAGVDWRSTGHDLLRLAAAFFSIGALLALVGGGFLVATGAVSMKLPFLPAGVAVLGLLGLVVAVVRRARPLALIVSGGALVAAAALAVGLASFPSGVGDRVEVVGPGNPLRDRYEHSAGSLVLDLGDLSLPPGDRRRVVAEVGAGQLKVIVPLGLTTAVDARVGAGAITLFGREQSGPSVSLTDTHPGIEELGRLDLDLDVGVGEIRVEVAALKTFEAQCRVPSEAKGDGTDAVTCPHPSALAAKAMTCSVALADPDGRVDGQAWCRLGGNAVQRIGFYATSCEVPANSDQATCAPLEPDRVQGLRSFRDATTPTPAPPTTAPSAPTPASAAAPAQGAGAGPLTCGPPDATGVLTCTPTPAASTSTTVAATFRCTQDPATRQMTCTPA